VDPLGNDTASSPKRGKDMDPMVLYGVIGAAAVVLFLIFAFAIGSGGSSGRRRSSGSRSSYSHRRSNYRSPRDTTVGPGAARTREEARRRWEKLHLGR